MFDWGPMKKEMDYPLLFSYLLLAIIGIFLIYSATYYSEAKYLKVLYKKQILWICISGACLFVLMVFPTKYFYIFTYGAYGLSLVLLVLILVLAKSGLVNDRWLVLGGFQFQPSELAKFTTLLVLAQFFSSSKINFQKAADFIIPGLLVMVPAFLIAKQPDLGTSLVFLALLLPMFFWAGMHLVILLYLLLPFVNIICSFNWMSWMLFMCLLMVVLYFARPTLWTAVGIFVVNLVIGIATPYLWNHLHEYQRLRVLTFLNPEKDPLGAGYQIIQSKVALGSGGIFGKGFLQGTQTQLAFLPEQHTDFIFSVLGEEFGFIGVMIVLVLFFIIIYRGVSIAVSTHNRFASFLCIGVVTIIFFHVVVNLGMVVGLLPVTGVPLPFLSYGGSSFLMFSVMIGIVLGTAVKRGEY